MNHSFSIMKKASPLALFLFTASITMAQTPSPTPVNPATQPPGQEQIQPPTAPPAIAAAIAASASGDDCGAHDDDAYGRSDRAGSARAELSEFDGTTTAADTGPDARGNHQQQHPDACR